MFGSVIHVGRVVFLEFISFFHAYLDALLLDNLVVLFFILSSRILVRSGIYVHLSINHISDEE